MSKLFDLLNSIITKVNKAVRYSDAQSLTDEQKAQARTNIGAVSVDEVPTEVSVDDTLTKSGSAADAKATGDQIRALSDEIANLPGGSGSGDMQKSVYDPNNNAKDIFKYADDSAKLAVTNHTSSSDAHSDIRDLITGLTNRLNALADSDDTTLDQLSEIVAYIKSNKSMIDAITTEKVSVSDIVDNLTTSASNKPLSAAQGVALKALIDGITIPEKLPNPNALTFSGAVTGSYDGSSPLTVNIPSGGTSGGSSGWKGEITELFKLDLEDKSNLSLVDLGFPISDLFNYKEIRIQVRPTTNTSIGWLYFGTYSDSTHGRNDIFRSNGASHIWKIRPLGNKVIDAYINVGNPSIYKFDNGNEPFDNHNYCSKQAYIIDESMKSQNLCIYSLSTFSIALNINVWGVK